MERWSGKVAIVTGACVGIGPNIIKTLVQKNIKVVGFGRRTDRIDQLSSANGHIYPVRCDITQEDSVVKAFKWTVDNVGPVHILINNAGLTKSTNLTEGSAEAWRRVFDINVMALCICTREAVKMMREHGIAGQIIHMNSILGHSIPETLEPNMNVYPASKFAVTALTESLRQELRGLESKIKVSSISPGKISNGAPTTETPDSDDAPPSTLQLNAQDVTDAILYILSTGPNVQIHQLIMHPI